MTLGYRCADPIKLLSDNEVTQIHEGSLEVLRDCGVKFDSERALKILDDGGCQVDYQSGLVKFPIKIVEACLKNVPDTFYTTARNPKYNMKYSGEEIYFVNHSASKMVDLETGKRRSISLNDLIQLTTVIDALEDYHGVFWPCAGLSDKPPKVSGEWVTATLLRYTEKSIIASTFGGCAKWAILMADVVGVKIQGAAGPAPPLTYSKFQTEGLIDYAKAGHPVAICSGIVSGATGPVTLAGTLVQQNAEILAATVLTQLINPGLGIFYGTETMTMDMRTGRLASGSVETALLTAAAAQLSHFYKMSTKSHFPMTEAKTPDQQCGYERALQLLLLALAGTNYIIHGGGVDDEELLHFDQLVIDNDIYGMVGRILGGIAVNKDTLAVDLIKQVGPIPGSYMDKRHTKDWWKKENYIPRVSDRNDYNVWVNKGSKDILTVAREKVMDILKNHEPVPLPEEQDREIAKILKAVEKEKLGS